jgi:cytidine deaminase
MNSPSIKKIQPLYDLAKSARDHSYSPYSLYRVGAAVRMKDGRTFSGTNVENSSYGATVCAERVALWKAVSETRPASISADDRPRVEELVVVTDAIPPWPPCGMCRQVLAEFASPATLIHICNLEGEMETFRFDELVPRAMDPSHVLRK